MKNRQKISGLEKTSQCACPLAAIFGQNGSASYAELSMTKMQSWGKGKELFYSPSRTDSDIPFRHTQKSIFLETPTKKRFRHHWAFYFSSMWKPIDDVTNLQWMIDKCKRTRKRYHINAYAKKRMNVRGRLNRILCTQQLEPRVKSQQSIFHPFFVYSD